MSAVTERWFPVLAAVLGLLGGVGGAAVGGYVANKGQEQRFKEERALRIRELRIDTYVKFLRAAENEKSHAPEVEDSILYTAAAEVALVAGSAELRQSADTLTDRAIDYDEAAPKPYNAARDSFVELAHAEIEAGA